MSDQPTPVDTEIKEIEADKKLASALVDVRSSAHSRIQLVIDGKEVESPYYSEKNWEDLHVPNPLITTLKENHFDRPFKVQELAISNITTNTQKHFLAQAPTSSGKTAAFGLSLLMRIDAKVAEVQAVVIAPTRELATQLFNNIVPWASTMDMTVALVLPGQVFTENVKDQIVIATPGTLERLTKRGKEQRFDFSHVRIAVVDEADALLNSTDSKNLTPKLIKSILSQSKNAQICLFSATFDKDVRAFIEKIVPEPRTVVTLPPAKLNTNVRQYKVKCTQTEKYDKLLTILSNIVVGQIMVFVERRDEADKLCAMLLKQKLGAVAFHSKIGDSNKQDEILQKRDEIFQQFLDEEIKILITTNALSRGIDQLALTVVINYDLPLTYPARRVDADNFVHRSGRTGRLGGGGVCITFSATDEMEEQVNYLESNLDFKMKEFEFSAVNYEEIQNFINNQ